MSKIATALLTLSLTLPAAVAIATDPAPAPAADGAAAVKPTKTASGLEYIDEKVGTGPTPKSGQMVSINYSLFIRDKRIEGSPASTPMQFTLGKDQALKGLEEGVSTMKVGGKRKVIVPPSLGYGSEQAGKVPPNSTIVIDVELVEIK